jgi:thioredoxin 1
VDLPAAPGRHDAANGGGIGEEVLAEALARSGASGFRGHSERDATMRARDRGQGLRARGVAMAGNGILTLTDDNFDEQIKKTSGPVLVDFWAAWCGPCKMIAPSLEQLAGEMAGRATVAKVNVDENGDVANRFGIRSIPTLIIFKEGRVVDQIVGALPKEQIRRMVEKHLA